LKDDPIPSSDHLALHCQQTGMEVDASGVPIGITRDAFRIDDDGISTNWVEYNGGNVASACMLICATRRVRKSHRVGVFQVGEALQIGASADKQIEAVHDPIEPPDPKPNPGHALLRGDLDDTLLDLLTPIVVLHLFTGAALQSSKG
jgi:hypothetical protein